ncbi:MAG: hypothetical protein WCE23_02875 [Candidatus Binatus sp.]
MTDSPTIANEENLTLRNPRIMLDHRIGVALTVRRWRCWRLAKTVARGTAKYLVALTSCPLTSIQKLARARRRLTAIWSLFFRSIDAFEKSKSTIN